MTTTPRRVRGTMAAGLAAALLVAACSSDDTQTATTDDVPAETTSNQIDDHSDGEGLEVGDADVVPSLEVTATPDAKSGVNLRVQVAGMRFAPEHVSDEHVEGEGHAHVYVDGEKVARLYTEWMHLALDEGDHEIRVGLTANDHRPFLVDGEPIEQTVQVSAPAVPESHMHGEGTEAAAPAPTVALEVTEDAKSGWNVRIVTTDFRFAPEEASTMTTDPGEGHAHAYLDGRKLGRVYGEWFHLDEELTAGEHELRVELSANDHSVWTVAGEPIEAVSTITVAGDGDAPAEAPEGVVLEVTVTDGVVDGGGRTRVPLGETVTLRVTSDADDHIHLHGYDVFVDVAAGTTAEMVFVADIPGVFEVELEDSRIPLWDLEIS